MIIHSSSFISSLLPFCFYFLLFFFCYSQTLSYFSSSFFLSLSFSSHSLSFHSILLLYSSFPHFIYFFPFSLLFLYLRSSLSNIFNSVYSQFLNFFFILLLYFLFLIFTSCSLFFIPFPSFYANFGGLRALSIGELLCTASNQRYNVITRIVMAIHS